MVLQDAGLYHEQECLPLVGSHVGASVVGTLAEVRAELISLVVCADASGSSKVVVEQTFKNATLSPVEATYIYPVEEGSAVFAFSAEVNGRRIHAEAKPKPEVLP